MFDDQLLLCDLALIVFLVFGFTIPMGVVLEFHVFWDLLAGVAFAVLYLAVMEVLARRNGDSMFRYFLGGDSLAEE